MNNNYAKSICLRLLNALSSLKEEIYSESMLLSKLDLIDHLTNLIVHILNKKNFIKNITLREIKNENNIISCITNDNKFSIKLYNNLLIFVDTKNIKLNNILMHKINKEKKTNNIEIIEDYLNYYSNYENTKCDECLNILNNKEEYPFVKIMSDKTLYSFHDSCYSEYLNIIKIKNQFTKNKLSFILYFP